MAPGPRCSQRPTVGSKSGALQVVSSVSLETFGIATRGTIGRRRGEEPCRRFTIPRLVPGSEDRGVGSPWRGMQVCLGCNSRKARRPRDRQGGRPGGRPGVVVTALTVIVRDSVHPAVTVCHSELATHNGDVIVTPTTDQLKVSKDPSIRHSLLLPCPLRKTGFSARGLLVKVSSPRSRLHHLSQAPARIFVTGANPCVRRAARRFERGWKGGSKPSSYPFTFPWPSHAPLDIF